VRTRRDGRGWFRTSDLSRVKEDEPGDQSPEKLGDSSQLPLWEDESDSG
jgi:hypothetical protein